MMSQAKLKSQLKREEFIKSIAGRSFNPQETMRVLTHNLAIFGSWGTSKRISYDDEVLMLQVNGRYHKGKVWITLAWDDTYTVHITTNQLKVVKKYEMIYFDMLTETIDRFIETRG